MIEMSEILSFGAHFAVSYVILFVTYLWYRELTRREPMTFLELFLYMERFKESLENIIEEENKETRKTMFENSLKTYDRIKRTLKDNEQD